MLKDDYMMRQTDTLATTIARLVLRKTKTEYTPTAQAADAQADGLWFRLNQLVQAGALNEAEDLLYEETDEEDLRYLEIAVDFYVRLNHLTDKELEAGGFSREEIGEGLRELAGRYGVELSV